MPGSAQGCTIGADFPRLSPMTTNEPPPYPGDPHPPNPPGGDGLPPYGAQPPPGNYPPPPSGPGSFPAQPTQEPFSVGAALSYGWTKFKDNAGAIIVAVLALIVITVVVQIIGTILTSAAGGDSFFDVTETSTGVSFGSSFSAGGQLMSLLTSLVGTAVACVLSAGIIRGAIDITEGKKFDLAAAFGNLDYAKVIIVSILLSILTSVGLLLCVLPGVVAAFFTAFSLYFVVDKRIDPIESIKSSFALVKNNFGDVLVLLLASVAICIVGVIACFVGLLVAIPVVQIAWAYAYKRLQDQPVAP